MNAIELNAGPLRLALRPDLGGSLAGLWHHATPVLRSTEAPALQGPRTSASFPLVPYSNRLGQMRFSWQGQDYRTAPNFDASPHSLHGVGWQRPWSVEAHGLRHVTLSYRHVPDAHWPFAFETRQRLELEDDHLTMTLSATNTDEREQPMGLGWHPYFPRRSTSHLRLPVTHCWQLDEHHLPTHAEPHAGIADEVASLSLDHCFEGWSGPAVIDDACFTLTLTTSLSRAIVFTPPGRDFFCVEPVSHVSNAVQFDDPLQHGLVALQPGASTGAEFTLRIQVKP